MGRSLLISRTSIPSNCRTSCNMNKTLLFILLGLIVMAVSENLTEDKGGDALQALDETELNNFNELSKDEDDSADEDELRLRREADPKKKKKKRGKKSKKGGRKARKDKRKNKRKQKRKEKKRNKVAPSIERLACSRAVNSTCLDTAVKLLKIVQQRITNI